MRASRVKTHTVTIQDIPCEVRDEYGPLMMFFAQKLQEDPGEGVASIMRMLGLARCNIVSIDGVELGAGMPKTFEELETVGQAIVEDIYDATGSWKNLTDFAAELMKSGAKQPDPTIPQAAST